MDLSKKNREERARYAAYFRLMAAEVPVAVYFENRHLSVTDIETEILKGSGPGSMMCCMMELDALKKDTSLEAEIAARLG